MLSGRDSGAADPLPFRALMPNPLDRSLPIGLRAIGKAGQQRIAAPKLVRPHSAIDGDRHLSTCRLSRPDGALFPMAREGGHIPKGPQRGMWSPRFLSVALAPST